MKTTLVNIGVALAFCLAMVGLSACDPKGQSCPHKGDVKAQDGHVYHCKYDPQLNGNTWQNLSAATPSPTPYPNGWKPSERG